MCSLLFDDYNEPIYKCPLLNTAFDSGTELNLSRTRSYLISLYHELIIRFYAHTRILLFSDFDHKN